MCGVVRFRDSGRRQRFCHDVFALEFRPAHLSPLNPVRASTVTGAPWASAAPTGPPLVLREPKFPKFRLGRSTSLRNGLACTCLELEAARVSLQSLCRESPVIETVILS